MQQGCYDREARTATGELLPCSFYFFPGSGLWATVNICGPTTRPKTLGIRVRIPYTGMPSLTLFARFEAQYATASGSWQPIPKAVSDWVDVGATRWSKQTGWSFSVETTTMVSLRGLVHLEWRDRKGVVIYKAQRLTTDGHADAQAGDPASYSAAVCQLASPVVVARAARAAPFLVAEPRSAL